MIVVTGNKSVIYGTDIVMWTLIGHRNNICYHSMFIPHTFK